MFSFTSPHPGHVVHHPNGAVLATFAPVMRGRKATHGEFATTDLHAALRLEADGVAEAHGFQRGTMAPEAIAELDAAKALVADGKLTVPDPEPPVGLPADEQEGDGETEPAKPAGKKRK